MTIEKNVAQSLSNTEPIIQNLIPMRNFVAPILFVLTSVVYAQVPYEEAIADLAKKLNTGLSGTAFKTVLVSPFKQLEGQNCSLSSTITLDLEGGLVGQPKTYKLLDRQNLEALAAEHKLEMNGMMDEEQRMREAGKLLKADAMIFGYFTYAGELLVLRVKAIDIQTSEQVSVLSSNCRPSAMLKALCAQPTVQTTNTGSTSKPFQIHGSTSTQGTGPVPCATGKGSACYTNNSKAAVRVLISSEKTENKALIIQPGVKECFYDIPAGVYQYAVGPGLEGPAWMAGEGARSGNLRIEPCGTGNYTFP